MGLLIAEAVEESKDFVLLPVGLSSERHAQEKILIGDKEITLIPPELHQEQLKGLSKSTIIVDHSHTSIATRNGELFTEAGIPFVMGTSGVDKKRLKKLVAKSEICAVIAPNMAPSLVLVQAMLEYAGKKFPEALKGYTLEIVESHQAAKQGVSQTAKTWAEFFQELGCNLEKAIESIRDPKRQAQLGIKDLAGHGCHWFTVKNPNGTAVVNLSTKIEGRNPYVEGDLMAFRFLRGQMQAGVKGKVFSMVNVLKG